MILAVIYAYSSFKFNLLHSHIQIKIILTMVTKVKAAHGEEAHKETTGLIYYESPQYR